MHPIVAHVSDVVTVVVEAIDSGSTEDEPTKAALKFTTTLLEDELTGATVVVEKSAAAPWAVHVAL